MSFRTAVVSRRRPQHDDTVARLHLTVRQPSVRPEKTCRLGEAERARKPCERRDPVFVGDHRDDGGCALTRVLVPGADSRTARARLVAHHAATAHCARLPGRRALPILPGPLGRSHWSSFEDAYGAPTSTAQSSRATFVPTFDLAARTR